ncbi:MAG: N-acetylmuramoyl-L-alanine amidase [Bryobacteraceae bacterium]|jgi:N-acetylmuramoyl-L-alanine amidase
MPRTLIPLLALLAAGPPGQIRGGQLREVTAVRCWSLSEATRVVIEVDGEFEFHAERAHNPERLFFDVKGSRPHIKGHRYYSADVGDKLVKKVRVAETQVGVTRVVLDLQGAADYSANQLSNPDRLVVELRPMGRTSRSGGPLGRVLQDPLPAPRTPAATQTLPPPPVLTPSPVPRTGPLPTSAPVAALASPAMRPSTETQPEAKTSRPADRVESGRAAKLAGDWPGSLTRALGLKIRRVVLDPGHGGQDEGTAGPNGLLEKDLVLDVALRLGKLIESRMASEVVFTRSDDTFIPLERRTAIANEKKADLFLSIHANSSPYPLIGGVESYYLNFTTAKDALAVASRENASSDKSVFELRDLIQKITLQDKAEESRQFAGSIQAALFPFAVRYNPGIKNRGVKKAPFVVLIGASMPSVLAEIGFLSNAREAALLSKPEHRQKLAEALYRGVSRYEQSLSHFELAQAAGQLKN